MDRERFQRIFLLLLTAAISLVFVGVVRPFLMTILMAGIFAGLSQPLYRSLLRRCRGRRRVASGLCLLVLLVVVAAPLLGMLGLVAAEALSISEQVVPWVQQRITEPDQIWRPIAESQLVERLAPYREPIYAKAGELVGAASTFLFDSLTATTRGTVGFLFQFSVLVITLFYFLSDGAALLRRILWYLPLDHDAEARMLDRFTSVTRATLKGTLVIGLLQGVLAGAAFAVVGIDGAMFWGAVMVLLSVVPGIGTALVWLPAAIVLAATGRPGAAVALTLWCAVVVGGIDNLIRPRLVGRDTEMHDLMILFSTMGGLMLFGVPGFVVGPIVAALFVTIWDIYGETFRDVLPPVRITGRDGKS